MRNLAALHRNVRSRATPLGLLKVIFRARVDLWRKGPSVCLSYLELPHCKQCPCTFTQTGIRQECFISAQLGLPKNNDKGPTECLAPLRAKIKRRKLFIANNKRRGHIRKVINVKIWWWAAILTYPTSVPFSPRPFCLLRYILRCTSVQ